MAGAGLHAFASPPTVDVGRALGSWATAAAAGAVGRKTTSRHAEVCAAISRAHLAIALHVSRAGQKFEH